MTIVAVDTGLLSVTALTICFVLLKSFGHITWSWWWVFSPLWLPPLVVFGLPIGVLCIALAGLAMFCLGWGFYLFVKWFWNDFLEILRKRIENGKEK